MKPEEQQLSNRELLASSRSDVHASQLLQFSHSISNHSTSLSASLSPLLGPRLLPVRLLLSGPTSRATASLSLLPPWPRASSPVQSSSSAVRPACSVLCFRCLLV
uniref:Uncharacterized protein n=1 Tax=Opuntia streptacantha TaxID=393608 RepID=A0A7C8YVD6_OPUST